MAPSSYAAEYMDSLARKNDPKAGDQSYSRKRAYQPKREEQPEPVKPEIRLAPETAMIPAEQNYINFAVVSRAILLFLVVGAVLILTVWMGARATEIQYSINATTRENVLLQDTITTMEIQIDSAVSFETVEEYATSQLKMKYPKSNQCIYIGEDAVVDPNLSKVIREKAYQE